MNYFYYILLLIILFFPLFIKLSYPLFKGTFLPVLLLF